MNNMTAQQDFFLYLLENYAAYKNRPTGEVLEEWDSKNITDFIFNMYEMYHSGALENVFDYIESLLLTGKTEW